MITGPASPPLANQTKRALLVGINYSGINYSDIKVKRGWCLRGTHSDIESMKELLIGKYDYAEENIVVLWDKADTLPEFLPTKGNITDLWRLEHNITSSFCGHSFQRDEDMTSQKRVEDDGLEEYIIPSNAVSTDGTILQDFVITDKALNARLVKPMKDGCQLIALFDTCHSGTLLNLRHTKCNEFEARSALCQALDYIDGTTTSKRDNYRRIGMTPGPPPFFSGRQTSVQHTELLRSTSLSSPVRPTTIRVVEPDRGYVEPPCKPIIKSSTQTTVDSSSVEYNGAPSAWIRNVCRRTLNWTKSNHCSGFCSTNLMRDRPRSQVICFSACKDSQMAFEGNNGGSMVQAIINCLAENPTSTARELMTAIKFGITIKRAEAVREQQKLRWSNKTCCLAWMPESVYKWHWHARRCSDKHDENLRRFIESHCDPQLSTRYPFNLNAQLKF
ncbi:hypothetical protein CPC08DRAFT_768933 [Agrocybe pediades]|nr:hypothetical protein CPC08DRAFT_768933 [Agrocybe pediades]